MADHRGAPAQPPWLAGTRSAEAIARCHPYQQRNDTVPVTAEDADDEIVDAAGDSPGRHRRDRYRGLSEFAAATPAEAVQEGDGSATWNGGRMPPASATQDSVAEQVRTDYRESVSAEPISAPDTAAGPGPGMDPVEMRAEALLRMLGTHRPDDYTDARAVPDPYVTPPVIVREVAPPAPMPFRTAPSLDDIALANDDRPAPQTGWRRVVYSATSGRVNPGESARDRERHDLYSRIRQPIRGDFRIAVLSIKGGVGKTTTTFGLGSAFATIRTDRVIAVDANPDRGTLAQRVADPSQATVSDLLADPDVSRYSDVRYYTRMAASRLEVLGSPLDPAISEAFGEQDYRRTIDILRNFYNVILTDCGTGIMHSAMAGVLDLAHAIVLVSSPALDAARSASATLEWLTNHGYGGLVREAHVVLSASGPGPAAVRMEMLHEHFAARCRSVHLIPFDSHLAEGGEVDIELLKPATFDAYVDVAGAISEKFSRLRPNA